MNNKRNENNYNFERSTGSVAYINKNTSSEDLEFPLAHYKPK